jgi:SAM-dependent methyltransferase
MSIVQLKSENPELSYVIKKNPDSGLKLTGIGQGVACAWFSSNNQSYNILFRDAEDEITYKDYQDQMFEYLNLSRYNSPLFVINSIDEFFRSAFKIKEEKDKPGYEHSFFINMMLVKNSRYIDAFADYFDDYKIEYKELVKNNYQIKITTKKSIFELLNFVSLFATFHAIINDDNLHIREENVGKCIKSLNIIDAPYFVRYLFKLRFMFGENKFSGFKDELEKTSRYIINMTFGDTWRARQEFVESQLDFKRNILDIGCGEGKYITRFSEYLKNIKYFAIDKDEEVLNKAKKRVANKQVPNVEFFNSLEEFKMIKFDEPVDIILSEVIEHMDVKEASKLVVDILKSIKFRKLIITTPDARFNVHYFMKGFRHDDHKFEFDRNEFIDFINDCMFKAGYPKNDNFNVNFVDIGDSVNGIPTSQGVVITDLDLK